LQDARKELIKVIALFPYLGPFCVNLLSRGITYCAGHVNSLKANVIRNDCLFPKMSTF